MSRRKHLSTSRPSSLPGRALGVVAVVMIAALAAGCTRQAPPPLPAPEPQVQAPAGAQGPIGKGRIEPSQPTPAAAPPQVRTEPVRVALLLPFSDARVAGVAAALDNAARLAEADLGDPNLIITRHDTFGTPDGAANAAYAALNGGAEIIIGPLFAASVSAVGPIAGQFGANVIAFSTDSTVAGGNVFLLSFAPEQEVDRVISYAISQGRPNISLLAPQNPYGERVRDLAQGAAFAHGGSLLTIVTYQPNQSGMRNAVRILSDSMRDVPGGLETQAVLTPDAGASLATLLPLLPYNDIDLRRVQLLGTGLWDDPRTGELAEIRGGWFAAPSLSQRELFTSRFREVHGATPPRIASLAYDAIALTAGLARAHPVDSFAPDNILDPNGFRGVDGIFRFRPDGLAERGLAVMRVRAGGHDEIAGAPDTFQALAF